MAGLSLSSIRSNNNTVAENHGSIDGVLVADMAAALAHGPGAYCWSLRCKVLFVVLPGTDILTHLYVERPEQDKDGNVERPTLLQSIGIAGWTGRLTRGNLIGICCKQRGSTRR